MISSKLSNFYTPGESKEICIKEQTIEIDWDSSSEDEKESDSFYPEVPYGIIDGSKDNPSYNELVESLEISSMTNQEIKRVVEKSLTDIFGINTSTSNKNFANKDDHDDNMEVDDDKGRISVDAVYLWRRYHYSIKSIAAKLSISKEKVNQILSLYRANVKKMIKANKRKLKNSGLTIEYDNVQLIKNYWNNPAKRPIRIKDIKEHVWPVNRFIKPLHDSTISRVLRNKLNMRYKVLQKRNPKTKSPNNIRIFHEAIAIQVMLRTKGFELIYVDEFSYSSRK